MSTAWFKGEFRLNSGSVTGGVLRGQKGRFQLFGDVMNTTSRMESNGVKGRIHVSEATAIELRSKGKQAWLQPRSNKVVAKGKGELQTYWVTVLQQDPSTIPSDLGRNDEPEHERQLPGFTHGGVISEWLVEEEVA